MILYLFDYGDNHVFTIKVEQAGPGKGRGTALRLPAGRPQGIAPTYGEDTLSWYSEAWHP